MRTSLYAAITNATRQSNRIRITVARPEQQSEDHAATGIRR